MLKRGGIFGYGTTCAPAAMVNWKRGTLLCSILVACMGLFWAQPQAMATPPEFDPLAYGTDGGPSGALFGYSPGGILGGGGTTFVTGWAATHFNGVTGRDLASPPSPRVGPVKSIVGGPHCSFGQIYPGGNAYLALAGGSKGVDPANCVIAGVIDAAHGLDNVPTQTIVFEIGYANLGLRISTERFLEVYGDLGSFTTNIRPSAGPMAFALWSTPGGVRLACSGHTPAVSATAVSSSMDQSGEISKILFVGASSSGGFGFKGGVRCLYFWDKDRAGFGQWSPAQLDAAVTGLSSRYGIVSPTELVVVAGDSYGAGYKLFGGESVAQWMAVNVPGRRVLNLAQAGAVASDPTFALPDVLHGQLPRILDPRNTDGFQPQSKSVVIFDGHNETLNQMPSPSTYAASKLAYTTALEAAGFRVIWADINPVTIRGTFDDSILAFEGRRRAYRAAVAAAQTSAVRLTYCDTVPGLSTAGGTPAEIVQVTRGECYYTPEEFGVPGSETWAVGTWSDETHMGVTGWTRVYPYLNSVLNGLVPAGACCVGAACTVQTPAACLAAGSKFASIGSSCNPSACEGTCCTFAGQCTITPLGECNTANTWTPATTCVASPCPLPPLGACCNLSIGICTITNIAECPVSMWAVDSLCSVSPCEAGACCTGTSCAMVATDACPATASFHGLGTLCGPPANPLTCCRANFNGVNGATVQDIFDFLNAWFAADPRADINTDGQLSVADVFEFLNLWFAGC